MSWLGRNTCVVHGAFFVETRVAKCSDVYLNENLIKNAFIITYYIALLAIGIRFQIVLSHHHLLMMMCKV